jgi:hypothetical protein
LTSLLALICARQYRLELAFGFFYVILILNENCMKSLRTTSDQKTISKILSWLNARKVEEARTGDSNAEESLLRSSLGGRIAPIIEWLNDVRSGLLNREPAFRILNIRLANCRFFPQLSLRKGKSDVDWLVAQDSSGDRNQLSMEAKRRFDLAVQEILSLRDRDLLRRLRKCQGVIAIGDGRSTGRKQHEPCPVWFYAAKNAKKRYHRDKCRLAADYARMTKAEKEKKKKDAIKRMARQRKNAKARERKELELSRKRERKRL